MIYIDFFIKSTQERHFYKFEGNSFEITELHIGRNGYEWTGSERNETHTIPIRFTMKTNLGEEHSFEIDCGYTEGKDWNHKKFRNYKMTHFCILEEKDGLYLTNGMKQIMNGKLTMSSKIKLHNTLIVKSKTIPIFSKNDIKK